MDQVLKSINEEREQVEENNKLLTQKLLASENMMKALQQSNNKLKADFQENTANKDNESKRGEKRKRLTIEEQYDNGYTSKQSSSTELTSSTTMSSPSSSVSSSSCPAAKRKRKETGRELTFSSSNDCNNRQNRKSTSGSQKATDKIARLQLELNNGMKQLQTERMEHTGTHNKLCKERKRHSETLNKLDYTKRELWELEE